MRRYRIAQTNKAAGRQVYFLLCASLHDSKSDRGVSSWISSNCPSSISRKSTSWNIENHWNTHPASSSCFGPSKILVHLSRLTGEARTWFGLPFVQGSSGRSKSFLGFQQCPFSKAEALSPKQSRNMGAFRGLSHFLVASALKMVELIEQKLSCTRFRSAAISRHEFGFACIGGHPPRLFL